MNRWMVWDGIRDLAYRFRRSAGELPRAAWVRWGWTAALGYAATLVAVVVTTRLARRLAEAGLTDWDQSSLRTVRDDFPLSFDAAVWWEAYGASSVLIPVTLVGVIVAIRRGRPVLAATILAAFVLAKPLILAGWQSWDRARPTLIADGVAAPPFHSFPSGHALQTVAVYGLLAYIWARHSRSTPERVLVMAAWIVLSAVVAVARLRVGAHWPSDVIGGSVMGVVWLGALIAAQRAAEDAGGR